MADYHYDVIVLGTGPSGEGAAIKITTISININTTNNISIIQPRLRIKPAIKGW